MTNIDTKIFICNIQFKDKYMAAIITGISCVNHYNALIYLKAHCCFH